MTSIVSKTQDPSADPVGFGRESMRTCAEHYAKTADLTEDDRRRWFKARMTSDLASSVEELRALTQVQLETLLFLESSESSITKPALDRITASIEAVADTLPGELAMRRVIMVHTVARDFSPADQSCLQSLVPGVFGRRFTTPASVDASVVDAKWSWRWLGRKR